MKNDWERMFFESVEAHKRSDAMVGWGVFVGVAIGLIVGVLFF